MKRWSAHGGEGLVDRAGPRQPDRARQLARHLHQFVNLLDLCGLLLPAATRPDGIPFGSTLLAPARRNAWFASIRRVLQLGQDQLGLDRPVRSRRFTTGRTGLHQLMMKVMS